MWGKWSFVAGGSVGIVAEEQAKSGFNSGIRIRGVGLVEARNSIGSGHDEENGAMYC